MSDLKVNSVNNVSVIAEPEKITKNTSIVNNQPVEAFSTDKPVTREKTPGVTWATKENVISKVNSPDKISSRISVGQPVFIQTDNIPMNPDYLKNTTVGIKKGNRPPSVKQALEPCFKIIEAYDPKAAEWLRSRKENEYLLSGDSIKVMMRDVEIYAAWTAIAREGAKLHVNDMILGNHFWEESDFDKATTLYHEYTHAVDNPIMRQFNKSYGAIDNLIHKNYGDKAEDKAYIAQWKMMKAFGRDEGLMYEEVKSYLEDRKFDLAKL